MGRQEMQQQPPVEINLGEMSPFISASQSQLQPQVCHMNASLIYWTCNFRRHFYANILHAIAPYFTLCHIFRIFQQTVCIIWLPTEWHHPCVRTPVERDGGVGSQAVLYHICAAYLVFMWQNINTKYAAEICAFSALTPLVGRQEGHPACKKLSGGVLAWLYLSGVRCRLAYGPVDATATRCLLLQ